MCARCSRDSVALFGIRSPSRRGRPLRPRCWGYFLCSYVIFFHRERLLRFDERFDLGLQPAGQQRELERRRRRVEGIDGAFLFIFRRGLRAGEGSSSRKRVGGVHRRVASLCLLQPERRRGDEVER